MMLVLVAIVIVLLQISFRVAIENVGNTNLCGNHELEPTG